MNTQTLMAVEKVLKEPTMAPLIKALMTNLESEFENKTPLAMSFIEVCHAVSSPFDAPLESLPLTDRATVATMATMLLGTRLVKLAKK